MRTVTGSTASRSLRAMFITVCSAFVAASVLVASVSDADARRKRSKAKPNKKYAAYVIDAKTGKVLHSRHGNAKRYPASLTKMMTLYLVFEELKRGTIKKSSRVVMSRNAASRQPSKLGVKAGRSISVHQAILSLVTKSANDVSVALAEKLSGTEKSFAVRMTKKARQLGMSRTTFKNANGLPNRHQTTTAADMAKLGLALREHFPRYYSYFKTRSFKYGRRKMGNHNKLLGRVRGVDGIKTGYTRASGFNLVTSVSTGGRKIVAVVMGGRSGRRRNAAMRGLVKKYLPKASRGKGRTLIARAQPPRTPAVSKVQVASVTLPKSAPSPTFSPDLRKVVDARVVDAHSSSKTDAQAVASVAKQIEGMKKQGAPIATKTTAVDASATASVKKPVPTEKSKKDGWQIQISATDSKNQARKILENARSKNKRVLSNVKNSTEAVKSNGSTLYRARFIGFSSQKAAERVCKKLKKQRFMCIALKG